MHDASKDTSTEGNVTNACPLILPSCISLTDSSLMACSYLNIYNTSRHIPQQQHFMPYVTSEGKKA